VCVYAAHGADQTIFGSPDLPHFRVDLLCDGDSVYSRKNLFEILGTPVKACLICTGIQVTSKRVGNHDSRNYCKSDLRACVAVDELIRCSD